MKKAISILLSALLLVSVCVIGAAAEESGAQVFVTIADANGNTVVVAEQIDVTDTDADGKLTINDALFAAHEAFYEGGAAAGYAISVTEYGPGVTKLWGSTAGSYGYYVNNLSAWSLADPVKDGDYVVAFVYTDLVGWSDHYSGFDRFAGEVSVGESFTLNYIEAAYDIDWNPISVPVAGAVITVDGEETDFTTDAEGNVSVTLTEEGTHIVSATVEGKRLVAPVFVAKVAPTAPLIGDADRSGEVTILDATHIQRYLADLVTKEEIDLSNADADRSEDVTILDATAIQRFLAGIVTAL